MVAGLHYRDRWIPRGQPVTIPRTLDKLRAIEDPAARALAAKAFIERASDLIDDARAVRDDAIRAYAETHSLSETAAACGVSIATVKVVKR